MMKSTTAGAAAATLASERGRWRPFESDRVIFTERMLQWKLRSKRVQAACENEMKISAGRSPYERASTPPKKNDVLRIWIPGRRKIQNQPRYVCRYRFTMN